MRQAGFYWVKDSDEGWIIAKWSYELNSDGHWWITGWECAVREHAFIEINEQRLLSPEEIKV